MKYPALEKKLRRKTFSGRRKEVRTRIIGFFGPVHRCPLFRVFHKIGEWIADISGNINGLYFKRAKINDLPFVVISNKHHVNVPCRLSLKIVQSNFCQRTPIRPVSEEKAGSVISDYPIFTEPNRACNDRMFVIINGTDAQGVFSFIFCTIGDFVVERTTTMGAIAIGGV